MPVKGGVAATREITRALPGTQVLVLTTLDDDETVFEAVRAGAHAYLLKDADGRRTARNHPRSEARRVATHPANRAKSDGSISPAGANGPARAKRSAAIRPAESSREPGIASPANATLVSPPAADASLTAEALTKKRRNSRAHRRRNEQPADRCRAVSRRGNRQKLCQPDHGQAACQYPDGTRIAVATPAACGLK